jgi:hypothetical protein
MDGCCTTLAVDDEDSVDGHGPHVTCLYNPYKRSLTSCVVVAGSEDSGVSRTKVETRSKRSCSEEKLDALGSTGDNEDDDNDDDMRRYEFANEAMN